VEKQIEQLSKIYPNMKIGIVLFNNEVTIIGDGFNDPLIIAGDKLNNYESLVEIAQTSEDKLFSNPICKSKELIIKKLCNIEETGGTALGPALLVSAYLSSKGKKGSKVIICTDGIAN